MALVYLNHFDSTDTASDGQPWNGCNLLGPANAFTSYTGPNAEFSPGARLYPLSGPGPIDDYAGLETDKIIGLADRDFFISFYVFNELTPDKSGYLYQGGPDDSFFSFALRLDNNRLSFYASQDGTSIEEVIGRSVSANQGFKTLWVVTRKDGWVTLRSGGSFDGSRAWYPHNIYQGFYPLMVGGSRTLQQLLPPNGNTTDLWQTAGVFDELIIKLDEGLDSELPVYTPPTTPEPDPPPTTINIFGQPSPATVAENAVATFEVGAFGVGTLTYQWYEIDDGLLVGETASTLDVTGTPAVAGNRYYVVVTDDNGSLESIRAQLNVTLDSPFFILQPSDTASDFYVGAITSFDVEVGGNGPFTFAWYWFDDDTPVSVLNQDDSGLITSFIYIQPNDTTNAGRRLYCEVTDTDGFKTKSDSALYQPLYFSSISPNPIDGAAGETITLVATPLETPTAGSYEWRYDNSEFIASTPYTSPTIDLLLDETMDGRSIVVDFFDFENFYPSAPVPITVGAPATIASRREMLVYNWEDDNYTWADAGFDDGAEIDGAVCMQYIFDPGWQTRWSDLEASGETWDDLTAAGTLWSDFYGIGAERSLYYLCGGGIYKADQIVKTDGVKEYYVNRLQIDLDDLVAEWTSNRFKHLRQFYFHAQTYELTEGDDPNTFEFSTGWSKNLMDDPTWKDPITVNMQTTGNDGVHKIDLRTTGRYLSLNIDFSQTLQFAMTGGDLDVEQAHGR